MLKCRNVDYVGRRWISLLSTARTGNYIPYAEFMEREGIAKPGQRWLPVDYGRRHIPVFKDMASSPGYFAHTWKVASRVAWDHIAEVAEMGNYQPKGDHPFARLGAIQRWWIDAQNILFVNRDSIRDELSQLCKELPRTYEEVDNQREKMGALIEALEMAHGKKKGSEEGESMRTYLRVQLGTEHKRDFLNQGMRTAVTSFMNLMSQEDERQHGCLTVDRVFTQILWTWRRVMLDVKGSPTPCQR